MNKMDRPAREPLGLLDELEKVLGIQAFPVNWPLGMGSDFKGVYDRKEKILHSFERTVGGAYKAPVSVSSINDAVVSEGFDAQAYAKFVEEVEMLELAGAEFSTDSVLAGETTPVFFGSAANNFGVELLLDGFLRYSSCPGPRKSKTVVVEPDNPSFSGFIFKIQANMDPRHRDRIAFLRVCSGKFSRDMSVIHQRTGKKYRLSNSHKLFARERETLDEAFPGDILGLVGYPEFAIGDTLTEDPAIAFAEIPKFPPECFGHLHNPNTAKYKQFRQGLDQLLQEGVIQLLTLKDSIVKVPLLAAVGPLQFEVVQYRLQSEYGAESRLEQASWTVLKWLPPEMTHEELDKLKLPTGSRIAFDSSEHPTVLFSNDWSANYFTETNKGVQLHALPPGEVAWD
jgi:peptide chain release factor 3